MASFSGIQPQTQINEGVGKHSVCNPKIAWNNKPDLQTAYKIWITHVSCEARVCLLRKNVKVNHAEANEVRAVNVSPSA